MVPTGRNTLAKQRVLCPITNSSGRKTVIQALRDDFDPPEISELTGHANPESISSYSHNPLQKQRGMLYKLAGCSSSRTTTNSDSSHALRQMLSTAQPRQATQQLLVTVTARAVGKMFTGVTFNNSPVIISINFQSNMTPTSNSLR